MMNKNVRTMQKLGMTSKIRFVMKSKIYHDVNDIKNTCSKYFVPEMMKKMSGQQKAGHEIRHDKNKSP